jgi:di/tricarboxylate transporter
METFSLFSVSPIGAVMIIVGILYFILAGRFVLPAVASKSTQASSTMEYFRNTYGLRAMHVYELEVTNNSSIIGKTVDEIETDHRIRVIAFEGSETGGVRMGAGSVDRGIGIKAGTTLGVLGRESDIKSYAANNRLTMKPELEVFGDSLSHVKAGVAELVVSPSSSLAGKSARDVWMRKQYGLSLLAIHRGDEVLNCQLGYDIRNEKLEVGDLLVVHTAWDDLARLESNRDFVIVTTDYPREELRPQKLPHALVFFVITLGLVIFSDLRLSASLLFGAVGMVLTGVLNIEEAYKAVSWKTVFLLASLIPLGYAVNDSGTAEWIARGTVAFVGDMDIWVIQLAIAILATAFTLVMSNVGATVLLVPLAVNIAVKVGADPAMFALTVALATSNSFLIPTHQVNALIMGPGGYRVPDFMRAGGIMTILFLIVVIVMMNLIFDIKVPTPGG